MSAELFGTIIVSLWTVVVLPFVAYGVKWLKQKIDSAEYDAVVDALRIGIENVGSQTADELKHSVADGKITEREWRAMRAGLRDHAKSEAAAILSGATRKAFYRLGDEGIDYLIRNLVDERAERKRQDDAYVDEIIAAERIAHAKREAEYKAKHGDK